MSYHTIQHYDTLYNDENIRLISGSNRLLMKVRTSPGGAMPLGKWLSGVTQALLIGTLILSGCTSENSGGQGKQTRQEQGGTANKRVHKQVGEASWYGPGFQGQETASGETFNQKGMTAAHPSLPMGTKATVTNLENDKKVVVRINDRGPYAGDRAIDLSRAAAKKLDMQEDGTTQVKIETKSSKKKWADDQSINTK